MYESIYFYWNHNHSRFYSSIHELLSLHCCVFLFCSCFNQLFFNFDFFCSKIDEIPFVACEINSLMLFFNLLKSSNLIRNAWLLPFVLNEIVSDLL